jgi:hydrogenase expression/formation protein HypD
MLERIQKAQRTIKAACVACDRQIQVMEVCGTHTVSIFRHGVRSLLPANFKLLSGPGCPVCVTDQGYMDWALELAERDDVIIATYGDMIRVPGRNGSLETRRADTHVRIVLSADDALQLAVDHPEKTVVFLAVGFETTTPATGVVVRDAVQRGIKNFCVLCGHKLVVPAMQALLSSKNDKIDAFLCPGHVSVIIGVDAYRDVVTGFGRPCVVAGFEAVQIMEGLAEICVQLQKGEPRLGSVYGAVVTRQGNAMAQEIMETFFDITDGPWRGLGVIPAGSLELKSEYDALNAVKRFDLREPDRTPPAGCRCGEILCGLLDPPQCGLFGKACTPEDPVGPCMVSSEGACAAWYKYGAEPKR